VNVVRQTFAHHKALKRHAIETVVLQIKNKEKPKKKSRRDGCYSSVAFQRLAWERTLNNIVPPQSPRRGEEKKTRYSNGYFTDLKKRKNKKKSRRDDCYISVAFQRLAAEREMF
jgi:hypothetical protein